MNEGAHTPGLTRHARTGWTASLGAVAHQAGTTFRVWAPSSSDVDLVLEAADGQREHRRLEREADGYFSGHFVDVRAGARYRYALDADGPFPDPASRFQPDGVHGSSLVVDPSAFAWSDDTWTGVPLEQLIVYELHVGTFTTAGTFAEVATKLAYVKALGITAIELMPVADFPGARNWGYDGAALFAPARCYGQPDDLRRLVDLAHAEGLAVLLDVVYNHSGPDGAYLNRFSPYYFTDHHKSPWGAGVNVDGSHSDSVRAFFIENAMHWIHEYHLDGLRLDATHAIHDDSERHFLAELSARVRASVPARHVLLIAEDHRNLSKMVEPEANGGWGLDAVWADDFHHQMRRLLAGDSDGYYRDYSGTSTDLAATVRQGWFYTGQYSSHLQAPRGTHASFTPPARFVLCLQNHDQIGNRALGERLHHQVDAAAYRAASMFFLLVPHTLLLFMGQEWASSSPFQYFTDHAEPLGQLVTEGRRREFADFAAFADPLARSHIPDPQRASTFDRSKLEWNEGAVEPHAGVRRLYAAALAFRRDVLAPGSLADAQTARAADADTLVLRRACQDGSWALVIARLRGSGSLDLSGLPFAPGAHEWQCVLTSDDVEFSSTQMPPRLHLAGDPPVIHFHAPCTVVLKSSPEHARRSTTDTEVNAGSTGFDDSDVAAGQCGSV